MTSMITQVQAIESYFISKIEAAMKTGGDLESVESFWKRGRAQGATEYPLIARENRSILNDQFTTNRDEATIDLTYAVVEANVEQDTGRETVEDLGLELAGLFLEATDWPDAIAELDVTTIEDGSADENGSLAISLVTFSVRFEHLRS